MTPLDFLRCYEYDERIIQGGYFSSAPLEVEEGDRVGVVLLNLGGPETLDDVQSFLYQLFMDPAALDLPVGGRLRHWISKALASLRSSAVRQDYELIGGGSPLTRLTHEQADSLECHLNEHYGHPTGVEFTTYPAMRYWHPFAEEAASQMEADGVDRVVLLPLYPQYSKCTSGSFLAYWNALVETDEIPSWPTTTVHEYAANPKYIQALSERIDEGLQRFPRDVRSDVQLVFAGHGVPRRDVQKREDPYCCLLRSTVQQVMKHRGHDRPYHTAFQPYVGWRQSLSPSTAQKLRELTEASVKSVLVVPIAFVTEHLETNFELDIEVREEAIAAGIDHYEVTSGLNTHPLFVEALAEASVAQLELPVDVNQLRFGGDGLSRDYSLQPLQELPRLSQNASPTPCPHCDRAVSARRWRLPEDGSEEDMASPRDDQAHPSQSDASESHAPS